MQTSDSESGGDVADLLDGPADSFSLRLTVPAGIFGSIAVLAV